VIGGQAAGGNDAMDMWVNVEFFDHRCAAR